MDFVLHNLCHLTHGNCHAAARDPRWRIGIESVDGETTGPGPICWGKLRRPVGLYQDRGWLAVTEDMAAGPVRYLTISSDEIAPLYLFRPGDAAGWVSRLRGYRYHPRDPLSGAPWPPMPTVFTELATEAADWAG